MPRYEAEVCFHAFSHHIVRDTTDWLDLFNIIFIVDWLSKILILIAEKDIFEKVVKKRCFF